MVRGAVFAMFLGFCPLEGSLPLVVLVKDSTGVPVNATTGPAYRVYGAAGLQPSGTGGMTQLDSGNITDATAEAPIRVSSSGHQLTTGTRVVVAGGTGLTGLNGTWVVTVVDADHFTLDGSTGTGTYTGSGAWSIPGLYSATLAVTRATGYAAGLGYTVLVYGTVGASAWSTTLSFSVC